LTNKVAGYMSISPCMLVQSSVTPSRRCYRFNVPAPCRVAGRDASSRCHLTSRAAQLLPNCLAPLAPNTIDKSSARRRQMTGTGVVEQSEPCVHVASRWGMTQRLGTSIWQCGRIAASSRAPPWLELLASCGVRTRFLPAGVFNQAVRDSGSSNS
jgi:hypothetical protein